MHTIEYKGFKATIMKARRLPNDQVHNLPPGSPIDVYPVDAFEKPLDNWIKGPGNYVVPVDANWGLWFDWRDNDIMNTAILPSIKGMNPITGQRTNGFALERYEEKCPVHKIKFEDGLFCEKCNFKWPHQNYVAYPNIPWWDGFRSADGKVRQFFFTEDLLKSVPEQVIGKEDTVPAFGFAFFRTKVARNQSVSGELRKNIISNSLSSDLSFVSSDVKMKHKNSGNYAYFNHSTNFINDSSLEMKTSNSSSDDPIIGVSSPDTNLHINDTETLSRGIEIPPQKPIPVKEVGVGGGAEIRQVLNVDPIKLSDWENEPASVMRLYFVFTDQFKEIADKGMKDLVGVQDGFMNEIKIG